MKVAIVVTAANEAQAESCQKELDGRKDLADFLCLAVADPAGCRIGSGGGTLNALVAAHDAIAGPQSQTCDWLDEHLVCVVHSGGDSQRSPSQSVCGKAWSTLPLFGGRSVIDGSGRVPGCVEGRSRGMWCEFDGRLSATVFRGRLHLFARANVRMGLRAVQHTSVDVKAFSNGNFSWSRWEPVEFASYSFSQSHVYFACVDAFEDFLVALAPVSFPERH